MELHGFDIPDVSGCRTLLPPALTSLVLSRCSLHYWSILTEEEATVFDKDARRLSFFDALGNMPLLETLSITDTDLPGDLTESEDYVLPTKPVTFARLRQLTFQGNLRAVSRLMTNIDLPDTASISLWFKHDFVGIRDDPVIDVQRFLSVISKHIAAATQDGAYYAQTTLDFDMDPDKNGSRQAFYTFTDPCQRGSHALPERMEFRHYMDPDTFDFMDEICTFANSLCETVPHNGLDAALEISQVCPFVEYGPGPDAWLRCVAGMDGLTRLRLRCDAGLEFLSWLTESGEPPQEKTGTSSSTRYPHLRSLELEEECYITQNDGSGESVLPCLLRLLEHHLFIVSIKGCFGDLVSRKQLHERLGKKLRWDWRENWFADARGDTMECFPGMHPPIEIVTLPSSQ